MKLILDGPLLFASATVEYQDHQIEIDSLLIDTGSGGTVLSADIMSKIGIVPEPQDRIRRIAGVGGAEYVFEKTLNRLIVGELMVQDFTVEIGALDYGFGLQGILGLDFLMTTKAIIDLGNLTLG
jgi:hypothetical protein